MTESAGEALKVGDEKLGGDAGGIGPLVPKRVGSGTHKTCRMMCFVIENIIFASLPVPWSIWVKNCELNYGMYRFLVAVVSMMRHIHSSGPHYSFSMHWQSG